jgi:tetratricopeptide (TPR) repeat protein
MKNKILILFTMLVVLQANFAQGSKVSSAYMWMSDYEQSKSSKDIIKAQEFIDVASKHETTSIQGKTWYYRGLIYKMLSENAELKANGIDYSQEAATSFEKALTIEDKKFRSDDKVIMNLTDMSVNSFNTGVELFKALDYKAAYAKFNGTVKLNKILSANKSPEPVSSLTATEYSAIAASNAGMNEEAISAYKIMVEEDKVNNFYFKLADLHKKMGETALYSATLNEGNVAFPDDVNIIIAQLNILINSGKASDAITKIDKAIELQPENDMLYFVKGNTLENTGDIDGAIKLYEKAAEVNPKNDKALYNIGAVYFKKANKLIEEMNSLSMSAADTKKFEALDAERKSIYTKAKPYFEKVLAITPDDATSQRALKKINSTLEN